MNSRQRWAADNREIYDWLYKPDPSAPDVPDRPGWIYIAQDSDRPQILKIGLTVVGVAERLKALSANASSPTPFVELASFPSEAVDYDEWHIHELLKPYHHGNKRKEWFKLDLPTAVAACRKIIEPEPEPKPAREEPLLTFSEAFNCEPTIEPEPPRIPKPLPLRQNFDTKRQIGLERWREGKQS